MAKNEKFQSYVADVAAQALTTTAADIDAFLAEMCIRDRFLMAYGLNGTVVDSGFLISAVRMLLLIFPGIVMGILFLKANREDVYKRQSVQCRTGRNESDTQSLERTGTELLYPGTDSGNQR